MINQGKFLICKREKADFIHAGSNPAFRILNYSEQK